VYAIGDYISHPLHGAGMIDGVEVKKINGAERSYYILKLPVSDMKVLIPVEGCESIGVRDIVSSEVAESVLDSFRSVEVSMTQNWNKRYRENMLKIRSGDLFELAEVVKGLMCRDIERGLSTGERRMLHSAKQIFISELVVALDSSYESIENRLSALMA